MILEKLLIDNLPKEEVLAEKVHKAYCEYYKKSHGKEYWTKGDYSLLKEEVKLADRYTVRAVIFEVKQSLRKTIKAKAEGSLK